jgi:hypothetical protein
MKAHILKKKKRDSRVLKIKIKIEKEREIIHVKEV